MPVVEKSTGAGILYSVGDRGRLFATSFAGLGGRILVEAIPGRALAALDWSGKG